MVTTPTGMRIESIRLGDDERRHRLGRQAFGATEDFDPDAPRLRPEQVVCAYEGERMLGAVVTLDFTMTWGGRPVPCGGVSGVGVGPEARGRGVARAMLAESLRRMAERGQVVSALYPTTAALYRSMGYEVVGWFARRRVPLAEIPTAPADPLEWRAVPFDDPVLRALERPMIAAHDGWFVPDEGWVRRAVHRWQNDTKTNRYAYVGRRDGEDVVALVYRYASSDPFYELEIESFDAVDGPAVAAGLGFLAAHGTTAGELRTSLPSSVLALHLPHVQRASVVSDWPWMLRLVEPAGAVAARGWPSGVTGRVSLALTDEARPENSGPWVLEVEDGTAQLTPGGAGAIACTAPELALVYAGGDVRAMHAAGRLRGAATRDLDLLTAACASTPTIPYFF